jgi:hypothetical protein
MCKVKVLQFLLPLIYSPMALADEPFRVNEYSFSVTVSTPPAAVCVVDSRGQVTGADLFNEFDAVGQGKNIKQIPSSLVNQNNQVGENTGEFSLKTGWYIVIADGGFQEYKIRCKGLVDGICKIDLDWNNRNNNISSKTIYLATKKGEQKELSVIINPNSTVFFTSTRIIDPRGTLASIEVCCVSGEIFPGGVCNSLSSKMQSAIKLQDMGNSRASLGVVKAYLNELNAQSGKHVKEPAATILREEAEAILKSLEEHQAVPSAVPAKARKHWWWPF